MGPLERRGLVLISLELLPIPGGTIELRDARSSTSRLVELTAFELGRTHITQAEWHQVMSDGGSPPSAVGLPAHPVTWFQAILFCNAASALAGLAPAYAVAGREVAWDVAADGYRLPTEAEWEWAARAGTSAPTYGSLTEIAWTALDGAAGPQPVAGKQPNGFGLFDMLGNLWEWCWDYADTARYADYRSLRGAGWDDPIWSARASVRRGSAPDAVLEDVGLRVARGAVGSVGSTDSGAGSAASGSGAGSAASGSGAGSAAAQGWSDAADRERAAVRGPLPMGWTPLRFP